MKKIRLRLLIGFICLCACFTLFNTTKIKAATDEFENINLVCQPKLSDSDKVECKLTWETSEKVYYLEVSIKLQNGKSQTFKAYANSTDSDKRPYFSCQKMTEQGEEYYINELYFDLYNHQSGNMNITFKYSYTPLPPDCEPPFSCTYIFATGTWIDKQPAYVAVISGIIITLCCAIASYLIIENSHRVIGYSDQSDEEEDNNE